MSVHTPSAAPPTPPPASLAADGASRAAGRKRGLALAGTLAAVAALVAWGERLPAPLPADAPADRFAEARATPVVHHLADSIGDRGIGTAGRDSAARYLAGLLGAIPGVEVSVQDELVVAPYVFAPGVTSWYRARNVVARIPGRERTAVLFSTHYDSSPESVGAGDAAMVVAASVEAIRALAADGRRPRNTLLFHFGDGEEDGLLGSAAFLRHPWAQDVRAFVNLESAGPAGRALLFQAGPGNAWLARAYARAVSRPYGTVLAQDLFQSGIVPSDTDFRIYRDQGGLRGLDLATVRDGYAYHTALDRPERIPPGTIQHLGGTLLGLARGLGARDLPGDIGGPPGVYYSVLGRGMLVYGAGTARLLAGAALLLFVGALAFALRRRAVTLSGVAAGFAAALLAWVAGLACALLAARAVGSLLDRPHGWFAHPWLAVLAFGGVALAGAAGARALVARLQARRARPADERRLGGWAGALAFWCVALLWLTAAGLGSAYLALWWVLPAAAALVLAAAAPRRGVAWLPLALVPGALMTAEAGVLLVGFFIPLAGRMSSSSPLDPLIAVLVAAPLLAVATLALAPVERVRTLGVAAGLLGVLGLAGGVGLVLASPYSAERPQRLALLENHEPDGTGSLTVTGGDAADLGPLLRNVPLPFQSDGEPRVYRAAVSSPSTLPLPATRVSASVVDPARGTRTVRLSVAGGEYRRLVLDLPRDRLAGWSLSPALPALPEGEDSYRVRIIPGQGQPWEASFELRGGAPVEARLTVIDEPADGGAAPQVARRLPPWVVTSTRRVRATIVRF
jgi:hypothetical protein